MDAYRKLFTATLLSLAIFAGISSLGVPAQALPIAPTSLPGQAPGGLPDSLQHQGRNRQALRTHLASLSPAERAVIRDLAALERLYRRQGKLSAVDALYRDLLKRTQNPTLQRFAERRLAKSAVNRGDLSAAETHLRASLNAGLNQAELNQY